MFLEGSGYVHAYQYTLHGNNFTFNLLDYADIKSAFAKELAIS
jgi:hypothetical protein